MTGTLIDWLLPQAAFWAAFLAMYRMEARLRRQSAGTGEQDRESRVVIGLSLMAGFLLGWILSAVPILRFNSPVVYWSGIGLMVAGVLFRRHAVGTLGRAFSVYATVQEGQQLVQTGPYRYLRHPAYSGALLWLVGIGLAFGNVPGLLVVVGVPLLWGYRYRIYIEEAVLLQAWGDAYRDYMRRTYRLIPFVW